MLADCRDFCRDCSDRLVHLHTSQPILLQGGPLIEKEWVAGFLLRNQLFANNPAVDFQDRLSKPLPNIRIENARLDRVRVLHLDKNAITPG